MNSVNILKLTFTSLIFSMHVNAQEAKEREALPFNRWSVEANVGLNKPVRPFSVGYFSSDPSKYSNFSEVNHFDIGVRYMLSSIFGLKLDYARDQFNEQSGSGSLPFDTESNRIGLQGVMNLGRVLQFESFSNRLGLLVHGGIQFSQFSVNQGINQNLSEDNGGIIFGITPQVRLAKWLALTADFTVVNNIRQHLNWDGSLSASDNNLAGLQYNTSLGLTFYLGKKNQHADWYLDDKKEISEVANLKKELTKLQEKTVAFEKSNLDSDLDGVPDYRDAEPNTTLGSVVNTKGQTVNLEALTKETPVKTNFELTATDLINQLKEQKRLVLFFTTNNVNLIDQSKVDIAYITELLKKYPEIKVDLIGYADPTGSDVSNKKLSLRRAQRIKQILVRSFIEESRINAFGEGVYGLSETKTDPSSFIIARRVEVKLYIPNP